MSEPYGVGHVKRNPATGHVAVRNIFPSDDETFVNMQWLVATVNIGARNASTAEVEAWDDLYVAPTE